jgi:hypothetical protein
VLLRERLNNWSLLLADVSNWATRRGIPKGSGQGNRVTTTIPFLSAVLLATGDGYTTQHQAISVSQWRELLPKTHSVAYTSKEIAEVERVPGGEFAKTVVLRADEQ